MLYRTWLLDLTWKGTSLQVFLLAQLTPREHASVIAPLYYMCTVRRVLFTPSAADALRRLFERCSNIPQRV